MYYIYAHTRNDTNQIFYIGKGQGNRAWTKRRSIYWHNITQKVGYSVEILATFISEQEAFQQEINCIKWLDNLCNLTLGGEGCSGLKHSEETKSKIRIWHTGKIVSEDTKKLLSKINTGKTHSFESKVKMSKSRKGNQSCLGYKHTTETKNKVSKSLEGNFRRLKYITYATNIVSGKVIELIGKKDFKNFGFDPECVYGCLNGKYGQHKGHTFHRRELSYDESFSRRRVDRSEIL